MINALFALFVFFGIPLLTKVNIPPLIIEYKLSNKLAASSSVKPVTIVFVIKSPLSPNAAKRRILVADIAAAVRASTFFFNSSSLSFILIPCALISSSTNSYELDLGINRPFISNLAPLSCPIINFISVGFSFLMICRTCFKIG